VKSYYIIWDSHLELIGKNSSDEVVGTCGGASTVCNILF